MKKLGLVASSFGLYALPFVASAQIELEGSEFQQSLANILEFINSTLIPFIIGIGFLVFVWGMFQYFIAGGANEDAKEKGKSLMVYAILGFVLIIVFWGIVNLLAASTGLDEQAFESTVEGPTI